MWLEIKSEGKGGDEKIQRSIHSDFSCSTDVSLFVTSGI